MTRLKETPDGASIQIGQDFLAQYAREHPVRKARYFSNRKIVWIERSYCPQPALEPGIVEPIQHCRVEYLANENVARMEMTISSDRTFDEHPQIAKVMTESEIICLSWHPEREQYEIRVDVPGTQSDAMIKQTQTGMPFPMKFSDYTSHLENLNPIYNNQLKESTRADVVAVEPCQWRGLSLVRVTFRTAQALIDADPQTPIRHHYGYFDPDHAWICHGIEAEPLPIDHVPEIKTYSNIIEYQNGPEGYPLPTRFTKSAEYRDGKVIPILVIDVESYERAYPQDDDLSLEYYGLSSSDMEPDESESSLSQRIFKKRSSLKWMIPAVLGLALIGILIGRFAIKTLPREELATPNSTPDY